MAAGRTRRHAPQWPLRPGLWFKADQTPCSSVAPELWFKADQAPCSSVAPQARALVQGGNHYMARCTAFVSTFPCLESLVKYSVCGHLLALLEHFPVCDLNN